MSPEFTLLTDHEAIRNCVARLACGEDRRSADLIRSSWWLEAHFDYGVYSRDFEAHCAWVVPGPEAIKDTQHVIGQSFMEIDGAPASAESHVFSYHRADMGLGDRDTCIGGRYLDRFEKRGGGKRRIIDRVMLYGWEQDGGAASDWSKGVMGYRFTEEHFTGQAKDDVGERRLTRDRN